ncbi:hypothetical protein GSY69_03550 [Brevibacterium sp. 5221]|uniref:GNAT family N-acetyltransferase n=1 Tax=Brevibacterium rongguiense TaxID=2695267 RepID=A0A6N9H4W9_9MICO|nr:MULTISPECIES: hypothetical protein [Brevibacterium]MYM19070.1 hypothetical protein [Brevibacterium rongguiense]WAL40092.1 hypothetical protein BRM1_12810 [Brevibacterium sp. BRM-1]
MSAIDSQVLAVAEDELAAAQEAAGIEMRLLHSAQEAADASLLLDEVWNVGQAGTTVLESGLLVALAHSGNYVAGAYTADSDELIGVTVGFFGAPLGKVMHSHIAGVRHDQVGRGTGAAMKLHQRLWCLSHGIRQMTWTFDPLIARNAYFNFHRLGTSAQEYFEDFYGQMRDGVNAGQASDRMLVSWRLDRPARREALPADVAERCSPALTCDEAGEPVLTEVPRTADYVSARVPADIESLRGDNPELATRWREALRTALTGLLADGWEIVGFTRTGEYILTHA